MTTTLITPEQALAEFPTEAARTAEYTRLDDLAEWIGGDTTYRVCNAEELLEAIADRRDVIESTDPRNADYR